MAEDDRLVEVRVRIRAGSLHRVDELARHKGTSRSDVIRDAVGWLVAREAAWLARAAYLEEARRLDDKRRAAVAMLRNPDL